jgi:hypothetical protein
MSSLPNRLKALRSLALKSVVLGSLAIGSQMLGLHDTTIHAQQPPAAATLANRNPAELGINGKPHSWAWSDEEVREAGVGFWPQYRGPLGDGQAAQGCDPPIQWSEEKNVQWKVSILGKAWSSPVVWGDRIWLTNASQDGLTMSVMAIDRNTGKVLIDRPVFTNAATQKDYHEFNSYGSPTPVCDAEHVYVLSLIHI